MRVYIWGTGYIAKKYLAMNELKREEIIGFIQSKKTENEFFHKRIFEPYEIKNTSYDYIIVCVFNACREIYEKCVELKLPQEKIIWTDNRELNNSFFAKNTSTSIWQKVAIEQENRDILRKLPKLAEMIENRNNYMERYMLVMRNGLDLKEKDNPLQQPEFIAREYLTDYGRFRTFELIAKEIILAKVKGSVAEAGVFRGTFSRLINAKFPNKTLYLFDTFESFDRTEFETEVSAGRCSDTFFQYFLDTDEEKVMARMPYPKKCVIRKGLFPATVRGLEKEKFAFVSLDMDFEKSILEGLRFFYPRINEGGAIFIHDYNNRFLEGVRKAVETYETESGYRMHKVPIADEGGTLIILK